MRVDCEGKGEVAVNHEPRLLTPPPYQDRTRLKRKQDSRLSSTTNTTKTLRQRPNRRIFMLAKHILTLRRALTRLRKRLLSSLRHHRVILRRESLACDGGRRSRRGGRGLRRGGSRSRQREIHNCSAFCRVVHRAVGGCLRDVVVVAVGVVFSRSRSRASLQHIGSVLS